MFRTHYEKYLRSFPIPRFLEVRSMGLDISDNAIRVMDLSKTPQGFIPHVYAEKKIRNSSLSANRDEIKKNLIELVRELGMKFVRASLPEEKAYLFKTEIPRVSPHEIAEAVSYTIEENAPVTLEEVIFDYHVVQEEELKNTIDVTVSVFPKNIIDEYVTLFDECGISVISFEIEAQAIARALLPADNTGSAILVHMGDTKTSVTIVSGGAVQFATTLPVGGNVFTRIIREEFSVSPEEAVQLKTQKDFIRNNEAPNVHRVFIETLSLLKDEVNKHTIYWATHNKNIKNSKHISKITTVYLSGRDACVPGFLDYMRGHLKGTVVMGNVWQNCFSIEDYIPNIIRNDSFIYAPAIGLILPK